MAKGKHSTALFEVIHSANKPDRVAQSLRTPKWWFKGTLPKQPGVLTEPTFSEPDPLPELERASAPRPSPARRGNTRSGVQFDFDRTRQEITLRVRYTTAMVGAFTVFMLIGLAYVLGRHLGHGPQMAMADETPHVQRLRQEPPQQGVTDVQRQRQAASSPAQQPIHEPLRPPEQANAAKPHERQTAAPSLVPEGIESSLPRTVGLQYVIIATYPPSQMKAGEEARDHLTGNGLPCTLERLPEFAPKQGWMCLVGTAGFTKISSREYDAYVQNILHLGATLKASRFDQFQPSAFRWRGN